MAEEKPVDPKVAKQHPGNADHPAPAAETNAAAADTPPTAPPTGAAKEAAEKRLAEAEQKFAGREGSKGKLFSIFHGEEHHAAILEKRNAKLALEGKAELKELSMLQKIRPGKAAAVAGAVAVTGMVLASMGNKGPSEKAEAVEASRDESPQVARA